MCNKILKQARGKKAVLYGVINVALLAAASPVWATAAEEAPKVLEGGHLYLAMARVLAGAFVLALGAVGCAIGMSKIGLAALEGMARQPEVQGRLFTTMLIGMALIEALCLYCLVLALMLVA